MTQLASSNSSAEEELAYVRAIAEEGRNVPLVSGISFVVWGGIIGTAAIIHYLMLAGVLPRVSFYFVWSIALLTGWCVGYFATRNLGKAAGASSIGNRIVGAAWTGCGIFITLYWLTLIALNLLYGFENPSVGILFGTMFPLAFGFYGLAFFVTAVATHQPWYRLVSVGSWIIAAILVLTMAHDWTMLIAGFGTYAVVLTPGLIMLKNQPSQTV